ncbi:MAG: hypothetical protein Q8M40_07725 [Legionella sp.]|nr:hypothetical protein [Legionella sp.]
MTIFVKVAKILIIKVLDRSMEEASGKNQGLFSVFRDTVLSGKQRDLTLKLRRIIEDLNGDGEDSINLAILRKTISEIDTEVEKIRKQASPPQTRGHLNDTLIDINSKLDRLYNALNSLAFNLIDIPDDEDVFNIFCKHAAFYFGENIFFPETENFIDKALVITRLSTPVDIRDNKEECLITHLLSCKRTLDSIKEGFEDQRKKSVVNAIESIQRGNTDICNDAKYTSFIPISPIPEVAFVPPVRLKALSIKPSRGRLRESMNKALEEIEQIYPEQASYLNMK